MTFKLSITFTGPDSEIAKKAYYRCLNRLSTDPDIKIAAASVAPLGGYTIESMLAHEETRK